MIPGIPRNIILQTGNSQILVTWDIVAGATSYSIQSSVDGVTFSVVGTSPVASYLDVAVVVGTNYFYRVASTNTDGTSSYGIPYPVSITPCLPGQINLGYLRYLAQLRADKLNSEYLTTDEWNSNINQSIYELYDILVTKFGDDYFFAPSLVVQLAGLEAYPLPDGSNYAGAPAIYKLSGVDVNYGGPTTGPNANWIPASRFNWSDRDKYTTFVGQIATISSANAVAYREMGNNLYVIPQYQSSSMRIWYVPIMTQLLKDTDMLSFSISGWSEYIIVDAAMKAMIKEESFDKWNALAQSKEMQISRIETTAANRDVGQPNAVSNTRSAMGDPGFSNWGGGFGGGFTGGGF